MLRKRKLPKRLMDGYWSSVRRLVKSKCGVTAKDARAETDRYRRELEPKVGDMIYHEDAEAVARTIAIGVSWAQVRTQLISRFGMTKVAAERAIAAYLKFADEQGFKESIFNRHAECVSADIASGIKKGFEKPTSL